MRTEDGSIIRECLNGDPSSFGVLVDKYKAGIYAFVYDKLRDFQDAQDVTQEVFEKAYSSLRSLRHWENFAFWLHRIARNLCINWIRDQSRRPDKEFIADQDPKILAVRSLGSYREDQLDKSLQEALDSLPDSYREVLLLHYFGGMTIKDIASSLGASPTAIGVRLSRGRAKLREEMVAMMGSAFRVQKLQSSFTFRVVEAVKRMKVPMTPRIAGLPWGVSFAIGIIITALSLNPQMSWQNSISLPAGSVFPSESMAPNVGEFPIDILRISEIPGISSQRGDGNGGEIVLPNLRNAFILSPQGQGGTWTRKADMPTARQDLSISAVNGKIYSIGGNNNKAPVVYFTVVEEYDPVTDKWTKKADMPTARSGLSTSAVNGKIYAIGGFKWPQYFSTVEEYDPFTDKWTKKADMPTARTALSTSVVNGRIYAIGGYTGDPGTSTPTVEEYDPIADRWTKKADMPTARGGLSTSVVNGKIYAMGGNRGAPGWGVLAIVREYDPVADKWIRKADMLAPGSNFSSSAANEKIYAIGGPLGVEEYDPVADKWTKKADIPTPRWYLSTSVVNGRIYAVGGVVGADPSLSTVEEYTPEGWPFAVSPQRKLLTTWGKVKSD